MIGDTWGATEQERGRPYPCDAVLPDADAALFRAVDVNAPPALLFRWLCQMRVAPYSYDWIDNWGRRSPRELTPGVERLELGQRVMTIFRLVDFEPDRQLTIIHRGPVFGVVAGTYAIEPVGSERSRLAVKLLVRRGGLLGGLYLRALAVGDLVMMRRQLLNFKALAELAADL